MHVSRAKPENRATKIRRTATTLAICTAACGLLTGCGDPSVGSGVNAKTKAAGENATATHAGKPNVLFILVDTLRADRLGCYGNLNGLTPVMDSVAAEGVLFERGIAQAPWTLPSVASLFSGVYPSVHGANKYETVETADVQSVGVNVLADTYETLAERTHAGGCATAGFVANIFLKPKFGLNQGFAFFDDSFVANDTPGSTVNAAAIQWLQQRKTDEPFFMYLHYMDVHAPYTADDRFVEPLVKKVADLPDKREVSREEYHKHPGYFKKSSAPYLKNPLHKPVMPYAEYWYARYDAGVAQIDFYIGELRSELQRMGLWDDLYVVITADHGEALGEHRVWTHGLTPHQDQLHVPMIIRWPGQVPAGKRITQSVRMFDLMPTLLEHLGLLDAGDIQARSLAGLIRGDETADRVALGEAVKDNFRLRALVEGKWKLIFNGATKRAWLFDLDNDPGEQTDVAAEHEDIVERIKAKLEEIVAENRERALRASNSTDQQVQPASQEELERLKALGYAGGDEESP